MIVMKHSPRFCVGIIGTRRRDASVAFKKVEKVFNNLSLNVRKNCWIVSGGCPKGGDRFAQIIAKKYGIPILIVYPDWDKYGKSAGFKRNTPVAEMSDILIACVAKDRKGGTEDTIKKFLRKIKKDWEFKKDNTWKKKAKKVLRIV